MTRRTTPSLALTATAALLFTAVAGSTQTASAAAGDPPAAIAIDLSPGAAAPGQAQTGTVTVTAADGTPVDVGQVVTLTVDHGFFTTGREETPSVKDAPAGNLEQSGATLSGLTDSNGEVTFHLGIERDAGFDDDGQVAAVVTAQAGTATKQQTASWSSANPLNGGSVEVVLSPADQQENPVAPAVSGDRTYYDVVTRDQFGNPVDGQSVALYFSESSDDYDYSEDSVVSDLALDGDFWLVSFVPATITVTGEWTTSSHVYTDTTGGAATGPVGLISGAAAASFYDISFGASSFAITSSTPGAAPVGTTVTQTVTVLDQRGNPVRGFEVQFFRFGPEAGGDEQRANRITNSRGQAAYSFVGAGPGTSKVSAVVTDGVASRTLVSEVVFRIPVSAALTAVKVKNKAESGAADVLKVKAGRSAAGARVAVYRVARGKLKLVGGKHAKRQKLDASGRLTIDVRDRNGRRRTNYVVVVRPTSTTFGDTSAMVKVR